MGSRRRDPARMVARVGVVILLVLVLLLVGAWLTTGVQPDPFGACRQPGQVCGR